MKHPSLAPWLRKRLAAGGEVERVQQLLDRWALRTVCSSAQCPNLFECFARGTAAFLILGPHCTRRCRFCAVAKGTPGPVDEGEPGRVVEAARRLGLRYVVVTSVTRDDLADGGAGPFARVVREVHERLGARVEVLTPDFGGRKESVATVVASGPDVYNHNLETVARLYAEVRPEASYERSLGVLAGVKRLAPGMVTKSGLMLGLGEDRREVHGALADLRAVGCEAVTLGQYLAPSPAHLPVARFLAPGEFAELAEEARELGFRGVAAGPFVRSSHGAAELFAALGVGSDPVPACGGVEDGGTACESR